MHSDEHPFTLELASLKAAVSKFQVFHFLVGSLFINIYFQRMKPTTPP